MDVDNMPVNKRKSLADQPLTARQYEILFKIYKTHNTSEYLTSAEIQKDGWDLISLSLIRSDLDRLECLGLIQSGTFDRKKLYKARVY